MTRSAAEKLAWTIGALALLAALFASPPNQPADPTLWFVSLTYLMGFHWIVAYCFDGTMYGALRLQPTHRVMRTVILTLGVALVVFSLQYLLGFGGPFA